MINFGPGTIYVSNPDGTSIGRLDINNCSIECEDECKDEINYISNDINNTIEASFECVAKVSRDILMAITGVSDIVVKCCPNRKVAYLALHSRKKRTRKKNFHRAIKILVELAEVNND